MDNFKHSSSNLCVGFQKIIDFFHSQHTISKETKFKAIGIFVSLGFTSHFSPTFLTSLDGVLHFDLKSGFVSCDRTSTSRSVRFLVENAMQNGAERTRRTHRQTMQRTCSLIEKRTKRWIIFHVFGNSAQLSWKMSFFFKELTSPTVGSTPCFSLLGFVSLIPGSNQLHLFIQATAENEKSSKIPKDLCHK